MMAELFCGLGTGSLQGDASEVQARVQGLLALAEEVSPGWDRYDLDLMGNWRPFSVERASIDALTQRTAMLRFERQGGGALGMLAMGRRGEPPSLLVRFASEGLPQVQVAKDRLLAALQSPALGGVIDRCGVSPSEARGTLFTQAKGLTTVGGVDIGCWWMALRQDKLTVPVTKLQAAGVSCEALGPFWSITLIPSPTMAPKEAVARWLAIAEHLSKP